MQRFKTSLSTFMLLCLLFSFAGLYVYEKQRADRFESQLNAMTAPLQKEIEKLEWSISKREKAYEYSLATIRPELDAQSTYQALGATTDGQPTIRLRREFANIRNAKLKIDRERMQLKQLQDELAKLLGRGQQ